MKFFSPVQGLLPNILCGQKTHLFRPAFLPKEMGFVVQSAASQHNLSAATGRGRPSRYPISSSIFEMGVPHPLRS
jgi:hypothetical protein